MEIKTTTAGELLDPKKNVFGYETILILNADATTKEIVNTIEKYKNTLQGWSDRKVIAEDMGTRRLSYEIKGHEEGYYALFTYRADATNIPELERLIRTDDMVLKFVTLKLSDEDAELKLGNEEYDPDLDLDVIASDPCEQRRKQNLQIDAMDVLLGLAKYNYEIIK